MPRIKRSVVKQIREKYHGEDREETLTSYETLAVEFGVSRNTVAAIITCTGRFARISDGNPTKAAISVGEGE